MNGIGKNIKKLRKERNLSQEQLAEQLHVTRQAVSGWETGKNQPDIETLESIAAVFDTDILMVLYGRPQNGDSEAQRLQRKKIYVRNGLIWGAMALVVLVIHLVIRDNIMDWYYRFQYPVFVGAFMLFIRPFGVFAAAEAFMNGISIIGDIRIGKAWIRRTILGVTLAVLVIYLAAALLFLIPGPMHGGGSLIGQSGRISVVFRIVAGALTSPALFLLPGVGLFLGVDR